jgi:cell division protein FtsB
MPLPLTLDQRVAQRLGQLSLQVLSLQSQVESQQEEIAKLTAERDRLLNELATRTSQQPLTPDAVHRPKPHGTGG